MTKAEEFFLKHQGKKVSLRSPPTRKDLNPIIVGYPTYHTDVITVGYFNENSGWQAPEEPHHIYISNEYNTLSYWHEYINRIELLE